MLGQRADRAPRPSRPPPSGARRRAVLGPSAEPSVEPSAEPSARSRAVIVATSDSSMSQPTNFRPSCFDATAVVPEPKPACLLRVGVSRPDIPREDVFSACQSGTLRLFPRQEETQSPDIGRPLEAIPLPRQAARFVRRALRPAPRGAEPHSSPPRSPPPGAGPSSCLAARVLSRFRQKATRSLPGEERLALRLSQALARARAVPLA